MEEPKDQPRALWWVHFSAIYYFQTKAQLQPIVISHRVELKRCVLLGCVVLVVKLLLSSFINLKNNPWSTRCFFCLGFVVQQTGKGVFGGQIPLVLTHLCLCTCPLFVLRSWVTSSSHALGPCHISLYFSASLEGEPPQHSQAVLG